MPLVLSNNKALLSLQPLAEEVEANKPPVINTYTPNVERWRGQLWEQMPPQLRARPDAAVLLDKALWVMGGPKSRGLGEHEGESSGNERAVGDGGAAWGLFQSHHIPPGSDANTQIQDMWRLVSNNPDQWTDWGENNLYQGKPFGLLGSHPYGGGSAAGASVGQQFAPQQGGMIAGTVQQTIGNTPKVTAYQDKLNQAYDKEQSPLIRSALSKAISKTNADVANIDTSSGLIDPSTGGVFGGDYRITQPQEQSPYVDASAQGTLRGKLQARREGEDQLGQAALAAGVGLPAIGLGPVATAVGAVGAEIGAGADERLGLPKFDLPVIGQMGPLELAGGALGGAKSENALNPAAIKTAFNPAGLAKGRSWTNATRPNLRVVQPQERPGGLNIINNKPDPADFVNKARQMGMSDEEIRSAFPGALEAAQGIDTAPQVTARIDQEQAAKGAAAKRIWNRAFDETHDVDFANEQARKAAAQAPEALPEQKPNVPYSDEAAEQMRTASQRVRRPDGSIVGEDNPVQPDDIAFGERISEPDLQRSVDYQESRLRAGEEHLRSLSDKDVRRLYEEARVNYQKWGEGRNLVNQRAYGQELYRRTKGAEGIPPQSGGRGNSIVEGGGTPLSPEDEELAQIAYGARALGDPATELRLQAQKALKGQAKGQVKSRLQQVIEDEQQDKGKRRTPEENARLKAERTAGPLNKPQTLQDMLEADEATFTPPTDNPNARQLELGGQGGQLGISETGPTGGPLTDRSQTQYPRFDAKSVAERARLSAEYAKNTGGPQMSEAEFKSAWNSVKTARDGGRRWPDDWTQQKINAFQKLEQGLTGQADPAAVGEDMTGGLLKGPLFDEGKTDFSDVAQPTPKSRQQWLDEQGEVKRSRLLREFDEEEAQRILDVEKRAAEWKPGIPILSTVADLVSLPRALQTRFDFSYPFRQGVLLIRRQKEFWDSFQAGFKGLLDEGYADEVERVYRSAPYNPDSLKFTSWKPGNGLMGREEAFYNRLLDKGPAWLKSAFNASERGATVFINKLRSDVVNSTARKWIREGLDPTDQQFIDDLEVFGNYVNRATGYGDLGELEKAVGALNQVFYGARLNVARVQAPGYLFNKSARVRKEAFKDFMGLFAMGASTIALADLAGLDVGWNPDSANFGKIKVGNTRLDIWGGYQQMARLTYKLVTGQIDNPGSTEEFGKALAPFLGNKFSPQATSVIASGLAGEGTRESFQPIDRPAFSFTEGLTPLAWRGLVEAVKEDGALGGAIAVTGLFGTGVQSYETKTDVRDKVAQELKLGENYESLTPVLRAQVDKSQQVQDYDKANPSDYKKDKDAVIGPIDQKQAQYEQAFKQNKLDKPLPEYWTDIGNERRGAMNALSNQFKDMFEGFDKTRYDKAVAGYYELGDSPQTKNPDGSINFDALESARQDFIKTLPADEKQWLDEALQVSRESKSPARQKYLKYIDERKAAGYFDLKLATMSSGDRAKALVELDRKNPLQDALNWYWKGGLINPEDARIPALNSPEAVAYALQMAGDRPVKYAGLGRPLNQSPQVLQAWNDYSTRIQNYYTKTVPAYQDQIAQQMYGTTFDKLPDRASRERVASNILTQVRRGSPELEAILQYLGDTADPNGDYVVSAEAGEHLRRMIAKYGSQPVKSVNASGRPSKFMVRE